MTWCLIISLISLFSCEFRCCGISVSPDRCTSTVEEYESGTSDNVEIHLFGNQKHLSTAAPDTVTWELSHSFWKFCNSSIMVDRFEAVYWLEVFWDNLSVWEHKTAESVMRKYGERFCKVTLVVVTIIISVGWWTDGKNRCGWFCFWPVPWSWHIKTVEYMLTELSF